MSLTELFIIAVGLSMDAFAVAVCKGLAMPEMSWKNAGIVGLYFGGFQGLMPFLGYLLGSKFSGTIESYDHWIAFVLLALIGGNMIKEAFENGEEATDPSLDIKTMTLMAVATSIDALAVGVTFAFLQVGSCLPYSLSEALPSFCLPQVLRLEMYLAAVIRKKPNLPAA